MWDFLQLVSRLTFSRSPYIDTSLIRDACKKRVIGHPHPSFKKFDTWQTVIATYTESYDIGGVISTPDPGTVFWSEPTPLVSEPEDSSLDCEDALWTTFGTEDREAWSELTKMLDGLKVAKK